MIESDVTVSSHRPRYFYGDVLSLNLDQSFSIRQSEGPGFGTLVSQGAVSGMLLYFGFVTHGILTHPNFYNFLFVNALPQFLGIGLGIGSIVGGMIWACCHLAQRRLGKLVRCIVAVFALGFVCAVLVAIYGGEVKASDAPRIAGFLVVTGGAIGLFVGSRVKPWRELIRGQAGVDSGVFSALSGLILRLAVVFFLLRSIVMLAALLGLNYSRKGLVFTVIPLSHFAIASVLVFVRMRFWLLLPLALIVTSPVVAFATDVLTPEDSFVWYLTVGYLTVWAIFLFTRATPFLGKSRSEETLSIDPRKPVA